MIQTLDDSNDYNVFLDVADEIDRQDTKWGDKRSLPSPMWATILMEEVGEFAKECLEKNPERAREEIIQVAALAVQIAKAIDSGKFTR